MVALTTPSLGRPTQADLDDLMERTKAGVLTVIQTTKTRSITPVITALCLNAQCQVGLAIIGVVDDFNSDEDKDQAMLGVATVLRQRSLAPLALSMVTEAWQVSRSIDDPRALPRPADCPDRQEVVLIQTLAMDRRAIVSTAEIHRDATDRIVRLGTFEDMADAECRLLEKVFRYWVRLA